MTVKTVKLGGTASNITVGKVAHGLMTVVGHSEDSILDDKAVFTAIKAGVDLMPPGVKMFLNNAESYGPGLSTGNLEVLSRFYEKNPEYVDKTCLSIKVSAARQTRFNGSPYDPPFPSYSEEQKVAEMVFENRKDCPLLEDVDKITM